MNELLLYLDSALQTCSVALARGNNVICSNQSEVSNTAAEELNILIKQCLETAGCSLKDIKGVCISKGPGSYTGLRIGMSLAKGICFALDVPLFGINTLEMMVQGAIWRYEKAGYDLYIPMIDARRMEVFTTVYSISDGKLVCIQLPRAVVLDENSFKEFGSKKILFFGSGALKAKDILPFKHLFWHTYQPSAIDLVNMGNQLYLENSGANIAYSEPEYLKDYYFKGKS